MKTATDDEANGAANMTDNKWQQFQICLSDAEPEAMTWSLADTEQVTNQLEREIYGITSNEQKLFKKELSIRLIEYEALQEAILIHAPSSAKNISVRAECLRQSGRALSEPSETPRWQITLCPASIPRVALHIALRSLFHRLFLLCRSPILNERSGVVANCDHTSEWVHSVRACIGIAMRWVTLRKSLLTFLLPARKMQFSLY